jgi:hypothetical protein
VSLDKVNTPYDLTDLSPTQSITYISPTITFDTITASIGQNQCAVRKKSYDDTSILILYKVFDLQTKRTLVKFKDNLRTILYPSSHISDPIKAQFFHEFIIRDSLPKGNFMKSNNKVAFLCETTSWNKKQTLVVIELDQNLQTVKVGILTYMRFF